MTWRSRCRDGPPSTRLQRGRGPASRSAYSASVNRSAISNADASPYVRRSAMLLLFRSEEVPEYSGNGGFSTSRATSSPSASDMPRIPSCTSTPIASNSVCHETPSPASNGVARSNSNRPLAGQPQQPCCMVGVPVGHYAHVHPQSFQRKERIHEIAGLSRVGASVHQRGCSVRRHDEQGVRPAPRRVRGGGEGHCRESVQRSRRFP